MCGGAVGEAIDDSGVSFSNIDPTTEEGLTNLGLGGVGGGLSGLGDSLGDMLNPAPPDQEETEAERAASEVAAKQYQLAQDLEFVRDEYKDQVDKLNSESTKRAVQGRANVDAQDQLGQVRQVALGSSQRRGIDPTSGAGMDAMNMATNSGGAAIGSAKGESAFATDTIGLNQKENVIAQATGQGTKAVAGLGDIASRANQQAASDAFSDFNSRAATSSAIGTLAGAGLAYYGNSNQPGQTGSTVTQGQYEPVGQAGYYTASPGAMLT